MTQTPDTAGQGAPSSGTTLWVYGYEVRTRDGEHPLRQIRGVITRENRAARSSGRSWTARLILTQRAAQVLVVSASADGARERNRHFEAGLTALGIDLLPLLPMPVRRL
jgi:hypothetical protein